MAENFLTVEEAARVLRIGRTAAYQAARKWRQTAGAEGLPVVQIQGSLRVPRHELERLAGGEIEWPLDASPAAVIDLRDRDTRPTVPTRPTTKTRPQATKPAKQQQLSLTDQ